MGSGKAKIKVRLPRDIQIGCHTYRLFQKAPQGGDYDGDSLHLIQEMWVREDLPKTRKDYTLLHEVLHFITRVFPTDLSERDVECLAEGLSQFLFSDLGIEFDWSDIGVKEIKEREHNNGKVIE